MSDIERRYWDERYREGGAGRREPAAFLVSLDGLLPRAGRALDVGGGAGRNALWLAGRGLEVTLLDVSNVALDLAARAARAAGVGLACVRADLDDGAAALAPGPWDLIVDLYCLWRPVVALAPRVLAPGGLLVVAHATRRNLERHERPGPGHVLEEGELARLAAEAAAAGAGLDVVSCAEGWFEEGRHEARLVGRRRG